MIALLLACVAMACRDMLATFLTVAEARGRSLLAGTFDALLDLAMIGVTIYGAGIVLKHGWTERTMLIIGAMLVVSFFGTILWTRLSRRITALPAPPSEEVEALRQHVADLESQLMLKGVL